MPNWCINTVVFSSPDKKQLKDFHGKVKEWLKDKPTRFPKVSSGWLGRCLIESGLYEADEDGDLLENQNLPHCRAFLTDLEEIDGDSFTMYYDSAWSPMIKLWVEIIDHLNLNIGITFYSEEPGMGIYVTNDDDYNEVLVEYDVNGDCGSEYLLPEEVDDFVRDLIHSSEQDHEALMDEAKIYTMDHKDDYININKFMHCSIDEVE